MTSKNNSNSTFVLSVTALTTLFNTIGNYCFSEYQTIVSVSSPIAASVLSYFITWGLVYLPTLHSFKIITQSRDRCKSIDDLKEEIEAFEALINSTAALNDEARDAIRKNLSAKAIKLTSLQDES